jgi:hypothetical protein
VSTVGQQIAGIVYSGNQPFSGCTPLLVRIGLRSDHPGCRNGSHVAWTDNALLVSSFREDLRGHCTTFSNLKNQLLDWSFRWNYFQPPDHHRLHLREEYTRRARSKGDQRKAENPIQNNPDGHVEILAIRKCIQLLVCAVPISSSVR